MEGQKPILSVCLPTNGATQWVIPTLQSIYSQDVDIFLFEVVITDNGEDSTLPEALKKFDYPNLRYYHTEDKGFLNLVTCLQKGNGVFNKMLNHRMVLGPGMLREMIDVVEMYQDAKPVMYFLNGCLPLPEFVKCDNLDSFVRNMQYYVSWSAGIGFWDIDRDSLSTIIPNEMFPNTSVLFEHRQHSEYVIWNKEYGKLQEESGKGGYDLFHTFAVVLNDILRNLAERGRITDQTFCNFKNKLYKYLCSLYFLEVLNSDKTVHAYIIKDIKDSMMQYYGKCGYYWMVVRQNVYYCCYYVLKGCKKNIKTIFAPLCHIVAGSPSKIIKDNRSNE